MTLPKINSYTNWGRLEEVWLGDCYPAHFYDNLESEVRDIFYEITEKTQEDLTVIHRKLEEFGVQVRRPQYNRIEDFVVQDNSPSAGQLRKPMITPRDYFLVAGNTLYAPSWWRQSWTDAIADYSQDISSHVVESANIPKAYRINGANTVRVGRDLYLDSYFSEQDEYVDTQYLQNTFKDYRLHLLNNGGHVDACFAVLKPGLLLTSKYFSDYDRTFPGWNRINVLEPEFSKHNLSRRKNPRSNNKWFLPGITESAKFNEHVITYAKDWVGDYTETYFEVNCLMIDEHNVFILGENDGVFRELERHGITAHSLPFRTRTFWDGGLHCLTLDIRRQDTMVDLFPDRAEKFYTY